MIKQIMSTLHNHSSEITEIFICIQHMQTLLWKKYTETFPHTENFALDHQEGNTRKE